MSSEIRVIPIPAHMVRIETGPTQFQYTAHGKTLDDWPGVFIRGDSAANYALHLALFLKGDTNPITKLVVEGLLSTLESSNLTLGDKRP